MPSAPAPGRPLPRRAEAAGASCPNSNFLKGVKWSPDGACCLTASDDKWWAPQVRRGSALEKLHQRWHGRHQHQFQFVAVCSVLLRRTAADAARLAAPPSPRLTHTSLPPGRLRVFDLPQDATTRPSEEGEDDDEEQQEKKEEGCGAPSDTARRQQPGASTSGRASGPAAAAAAGRRRGDSLRSALRVHAGESVYDYAWFSCMTTADPASCCFASTTRVRAQAAGRALAGVGAPGRLPLAGAGLRLACARLGGLTLNLMLAVGQTQGSSPRWHAAANWCGQTCGSFPH